MGEDQGAAGETVGSEPDRPHEGDRTPEPEQERTPQEVRHDIEQTRAELGDTVAELAAKTDVKGQAHRAVDNAKATVAGKASDVAGKASDVKESAGVKKDQMAASAREAMPSSADDTRRQLMSRAQEHRLALIAVAAFGAGILIGKRRAS